MNIEENQPLSVTFVPPVAAFFYNKKARAIANADGNYNIWDLWAITGYGKWNQPSKTLYGTDLRVPHYLSYKEAIVYLMAYWKTVRPRQGHRRFNPRFDVYTGQNFDELPERLERSLYKQPMPTQSKGKPVYREISPAFSFFEVRANEYFDFNGHRFYGCNGYYLVNRIHGMPRTTPPTNFIENYPEYTLDRQASAKQIRQAYEELALTFSPMLKMYLKHCQDWMFPERRNERKRRFITEMRPHVAKENYEAKYKARHNAEKLCNHPKVPKLKTKSLRRLQDIRFNGPSPLVLRAYDEFIEEMALNFGFPYIELRSMCNRHQIKNNQEVDYHWQPKPIGMDSVGDDDRPWMKTGLLVNP